MFKKAFIPLYLIVFTALIYLIFFRDTTKHPDWESFNENVFKKAKRENKLVVLHLTANWCHWCHVMEENTYANPLIIEYLDKNYIVCKEDHDARQDLTSLYAEYGWPATIIFDADGHVLAKEAGFIDSDRFMTMLTQLHNNPTPLPDNSFQVDIRTTTDSSKQQSLDVLKKKFLNSIDIQEGGFNFGQKYIDFESFEYALNHISSDTTMLEWVENSVVNSTGIYDNTWGGVFQYSTNNDWKHVHYEKLLSVQARYIKIYCWYYKRYNNVDALKRAEGTAAYVDRFLASNNGGYYNAQDADLIPGKSATDYFALTDADRVKQGIPAVDENIYTSDNAELAEALVILWATDGNKMYLDKAIKCVSMLMHKHKFNNAYVHGEDHTITSLKDNLAMLKTLMLLYRATENAEYKSEAAKLAREISTTFNSGKGYLYSYIGSSPIKATYNISENIEACRLLNYASYFFKNPKCKSLAVEIASFLTNPALVKGLSTEAGILSATEELSKEPTIAALMLKNNTTLKPYFTTASISFPQFYFNNMVYTDKTIGSDKIDVFDAYDKNFIILCTSSYCSSPQFTIDAYKQLLYERLLGDTLKHN
jgi:uncharacterized protein YyaL (SSP411 family)